jgi:hypothetical protein
MAEGEGFEPPVPFQAQQFLRWRFNRARDGQPSEYHNYFWQLP